MSDYKGVVLVGTLGNGVESPSALQVIDSGEYVVGLAAVAKSLSSKSVHSTVGVRLHSCFNLFLGLCLLACVLPAA